MTKQKNVQAVPKQRLIECFWALCKKNYMVITQLNNNALEQEM